MKHKRELSHTAPTLRNIHVCAASLPGKVYIHPNWGKGGLGHFLPNPLVTVLDKCPNAMARYCPSRLTLLLFLENQISTKYFL